MNLNDITLYDLMAADHDIWITPNKKFGFDIQIDNEDGETIIDDKGLHPFAVEGFANICRRFLNFYECANDKIEKGDFKNDEKN